MRGWRKFLVCFVGMPVACVSLQEQTSESTFISGPKPKEVSSINVSCFADDVLFDPPIIAYPAECFENASSKEAVSVSWDLATEGGNPVNIKVLESSNACFNDAVIQGIKRRDYPPISECQQGAQVTGLADTFTFVKSD